MRWQARSSSTYLTNPFNPDGSGLVTAAGDSLSQQIAAAPESTDVVKAFNSTFRDVVAHDKPVDVFFAGDSAEAKARLTVFLESLDMRPLDAGGLERPSVLEWAGILLVGLARNGAGFDIPSGAKLHSETSARADEFSTVPASKPT